MSERITAEQIPEAARSAAITERFAGGSASEVIAAALNAWPGAYEFRSTRTPAQCLALPLTALGEPKDG